MVDKDSSELTCWAITQGSAGMESQVIGLAEAVGWPTTLKQCQRRAPWSWLPGAFYWRALQQLTPQSHPLSPPWPDLLISCGRRTVPLALAIKSASHGHTFCVHIQDPRVNPAWFDLVIAVQHDKLTAPNVVHTQAALHKLTQPKLEQAQEQFLQRHPHLAPPYWVVLLGGSSRHHQMTEAALEQIMENLKGILAAYPGTILLSPSRRTTPASIELLEKTWGQNPRVYIADLSKENPYLGFLGAADAILVTEDSVSMISEACFTGKPVYILSLPGHHHSKPKTFIACLRQKGMVRPFEGIIESYAYTPLNEADKIASIIKLSWQERLQHAKYPHLRSDSR